jgi:hypothetical protein
VIHGSPLSEDFAVRNQSSNELLLDDNATLEFGHSSDFGPFENETPILDFTRPVRTPNNAARPQVFEDPESPSYRRGMNVFFSSPITNLPLPRLSPEQLASSALYNTFVGTGDLELAEHIADGQAESRIEDDAVLNSPTQHTTPEQNTTEPDTDWRNSSPTLVDLINHVRSISSYDERLPVKSAEQESNNTQSQHVSNSSGTNDTEDEGYDSSSSTCVPYILNPNITIRSPHYRVSSLFRSQGTTNLIANHVRLPNVGIVPFAPFNTNAQARLD